MERALAAVLIAQLCGCSFVGLHSVAPDAPASVECSESKTDPAIDTVGALVIGTGGAVGIIANETKSNREAWATNVGIGMIALAIPLAISAWWGYRQVSRCREAHSHY